eukprot:3706098-Pyramimonas_sp.AAC.1
MKATNAALRAELELEAKTHSLDVAKSNLLKEPFLWQLLHYGKQYAPKFSVEYARLSNNWHLRVTQNQMYHVVESFWSSICNSVTRTGLVSHQLFSFWKIPSRNSSPAISAALSPRTFCGRIKLFSAGVA